MKNFTLVFLLASTISSFSQKQMFTIVSVNGQTFITKNYKQKNNGISFKEKDGNKTSIAYSEIDKIISTGKKDRFNFTLKPIRFSEKKSVFMKEIITGKVSLYERRVSDLVARENNNLTEIRYESYYLKKEDQPIAEFIDGNITYLKFKNNIIHYFSDCDNLVSKVKNNKGKLIKLEAIVTYYNEKCE